MKKSKKFVHYESTPKNLNPPLTKLPQIKTCVPNIIVMQFDIGISKN